MAALTLAACAPTEPLSLTAAPSPAGVRIEASAPLTRVELRTATGVPVVRDVPPTPTATVDLVASLDPGAYTVVATAGGATATTSLTVPVPPPVRVEVQPRPGAAWIEGAGTITVPVVAGGSAEVLVGVTGGPGKPAEVELAGEVVPLPVVGTRVVRPVRVSTAPVPLAVGDAHFTLVPAPVALADLARTVSLVGDVFPAESDGAPDLGRPASRVSLPSPAWERVVRAVGLGGRRRDEEAPWAFWGVTFRNDGDAAVDLHVSLEVRAPAGGPAPAFRPRLRTADGDTGTVAALLRVPAHGEARAALPVFVDTDAVTPGAYDAALTVTPLGGDTPVHAAVRPLYVRRGDPVASGGFALALVAFAGGAALTLARLRRWLDAAATSELMTIAIFGSATFLVGTASDLVAMGVGALLGPLSTLLTGLLSDLGRYTLLATLVTLLPRPGTLTLAVLTGWFLRGFTTGAFAPVDVLYTGVSIGIGELFAWVAGLTRGGAWRDEPLARRWARLSVGFAGASVCTTLAGLWMHVVLYRLFFAPWYVALQVLVPGFLYTVIACRVAADFAASLRKVEA